MATTVSSQKATRRTTPAASVTVEIDEDRIATVWLDQPGEKVNVMNITFIDDFERAVNGLPPDLTGVILASAKESNFVAGADLEQVLQATSAEDASEQIRRLHRILNRLANQPFPAVAAINGPALGGGLELALACDYRVCVENNGNILGLPEVQLGLLPAGGGSQRLPRLIGLSRALGLILEGKRYSPRRAKRYGVVDDVVHPAVLMTAARSLITRGKRHGHPQWSRLDEAAARWPLVRSIVYRQTEKTVRAKTRGHYPAPLKAFEVIRAGQEQGFGAGLAAEAVAFGELLMTPEARNLIHIFWATEGLKKEQRTLIKRARTVERVGIVGAGFMGAGIAQAAAVAGAQVRVRDIKPEQVARGLKTARGVTLSAARKGRFSRQEAQAIVSRLTGSTDYSGYKRADLVVEAVFEDVAIKRQVIAELENVLSPETVIASNTSSLPIGDLAANAKQPERIAGMHFFSPVHKMPLIEVIRAPRSSEETVATIVELGRKMGKTIIVVNDGPGFFTTRVLAFMVQEAGRLFEQGAAIEDIDRAMTAFGFPVGPLALTDEVGMDVGAHVAEVLGAAFPERYSSTGAINRMVAAGRLGRKSKAGFYDYSGRKKKPDPAVYAFRTSGPQKYPRDLIQRRLTLAFLNEAARCLEEGIIAGPRDGDVGAIMGLGFPPFLGGPFRYADTLGAQSIVDQLGQMAYAYGPTFRPAPILERMARNGESFYKD
jgi:3-hydroxyacyl-CoA dehydrogenase/enoyl-CoA hydratase/3-hydroxybutyryl-CoA epimerase